MNVFSRRPMSLKVTPDKSLHVRVVNRDYNNPTVLTSIENCLVEIEKKNTSRSLTVKCNKFILTRQSNIK